MPCYLLANINVLEDDFTKTLLHVSFGSMSSTTILFYLIFFYQFNIKIYNLLITYDYDRSTIQYHKTIPRGAKDHDYPRAIHMKNINLKLQLNIQLRETITNNGTEKRDSMIGERYRNEHGVVA